MAGMIFDLDVYYEGRDDADQVRADQRDMAAFELEYRMGTTTALEQRTVTFLRYIGWHAMRRTGRTEERFDRWEKNVTSVAEPDDDDDQDGEQQETADPTNPAP